MMEIIREETSPSAKAGKGMKLYPGAFFLALLLAFILLVVGCVVAAAVFDLDEDVFAKVMDLVFLPIFPFYMIASFFCALIGSRWMGTRGNDCFYAFLAFGVAWGVKAWLFSSPASFDEGGASAERMRSLDALMGSMKYGMAFTGLVHGAIYNMSVKKWAVAGTRVPGEGAGMRTPTPVRGVFEVVWRNLELVVAAVAIGALVGPIFGFFIFGGPAAPLLAIFSIFTIPYAVWLAKYGLIAYFLITTVLLLREWETQDRLVLAALLTALAQWYFGGSVLKYPIIDLAIFLSAALLVAVFHYRGLKKTKWRFVVRSPREERASMFEKIYGWIKPIVPDCWSIGLYAYVASLVLWEIAKAAVGPGKLPLSYMTESLPSAWSVFTLSSLCACVLLPFGRQGFFMLCAVAAGFLAAFLQPGLLRGEEWTLSDADFSFSLYFCVYSVIYAAFLWFSMFRKSGGVNA